MEYVCCRISEENKKLRDQNKSLELEIAQMRAVCDERARSIETLQKESTERNAEYIAQVKAVCDERARTMLKVMCVNTSIPFSIMTYSHPIVILKFGQIGSANESSGRIMWIFSHSRTYDAEIRSSLTMSGNVLELFVISYRYVNLLAIYFSYH